MHDRIKELRKTLKMNQTEFAESLGTSQGLVSSWERGANVSKSYVRLTSSTHNVRIEWLKTGEGDMFAPPPEKEQTPEEYAKACGCDDFLAGVFARYCKLSDAKKAEFASILQEVFDNPFPVLDIACPPREDYPQNSINISGDNNGEIRQSNY